MNASIYPDPNTSGDGDTTDNRKRIRPLENAPPNCPHCRDPITDAPVPMVEGLNESGYDRIACPACGLVAVEALAGEHPRCNRCDRRMHVANVLVTNSAQAIEYACPVCDMHGEEVVR